MRAQIGVTRYMGICRQFSPALSAKGVAAKGLKLSYHNPEPISFTKGPYHGDLT